MLSHTEILAPPRQTQPCHNPPMVMTDTPMLMHLIFALPPFKGPQTSIVSPEVALSELRDERGSRHSPIHRHSQDFVHLCQKNSSWTGEALVSRTYERESPNI